MTDAPATARIWQMRFRHVAWTALAIVSLVGGVDACVTTRGEALSGEACRFNFDCAEGLSCVSTKGSRVCHSLRPHQQTCASNEDCSDGKACKAGRCGLAPASLFKVLEQRCEDDDDCPPNNVCDLKNQRCKAGPTQDRSCTSSWDCKASQTCAFGECEDKQPLSDCRSDFQCGGFSRCIAGRCI